jgi:CRP-like cAMP-binding protein
VFFVQSGRVKLTVVSKQGKEAVVAFLGAGDFVGEGCLGGRMRRMSTASAVTECVITRVDRPAMIKMLRDEPRFSELFTSHVLARAIRVEEDLVDQLFNSSEKTASCACTNCASTRPCWTSSCTISRKSIKQNPESEGAMVPVYSPTAAVDCAVRSTEAVGPT